MAGNGAVWWIAWAAYAVPFVIVADLDWFALSASLYEELKQIQTLAAGVLAIAAATIAYRGARQQAEATIITGRLAIEERRRATAAALFGELSHARLALIAQAKALRATKVRRRNMLPIRVIPTPVFNSDPLAIGVLPGDSVYAVTFVFALLAEQNRTAEKLLAPSDAEIGDGVAALFADQLERIINSADTALVDLGNYTGIAQHTLSALTEHARARMTDG